MSIFSRDNGPRASYICLYPRLVFIVLLTCNTPPLLTWVYRSNNFIGQCFLLGCCVRSPASPPECTSRVRPPSAARRAACGCRRLRFPPCSLLLFSPATTVYIWEIHNQTHPLQLRLFTPPTSTGIKTTNSLHPLCS